MERRVSSDGCGVRIDGHDGNDDLTNALDWRLGIVEAAIGRSCIQRVRRLRDYLTAHLVGLSDEHVGLLAKPLRHVLPNGGLGHSKGAGVLELVGLRLAGEAAAGHERNRKSGDDDTHDRRYAPLE